MSTKEWKRTQQQREKIRAVLQKAALKRWLQLHGQHMRPPKLTDSVMRVISAWFQLVDDDGSGSLDSSELAAALKAAGLPCDEASITELIRLMDINKDGEICWSEFESFLASEFGAGKNLLSGEYMLPSGQSLPFGAMVSRLRRYRIFCDVTEGGRRREQWVDVASNEAKLKSELHLLSAAQEEQQAYLRENQLQDMTRHDMPHKKQEPASQQHGATRIGLDTSTSALADNSIQEQSTWGSATGRGSDDGCHHGSKDDNIPGTQEGEAILPSETPTISCSGMAGRSRRSKQIRHITSGDVQVTQACGRVAESNSSCNVTPCPGQVTGTAGGVVGPGIDSQQADVVPVYSSSMPRLTVRNRPATRDFQHLLSTASRKASRMLGSMTKRFGRVHDNMRKSGNDVSGAVHSGARNLESSFLMPDHDSAHHHRDVQDGGLGACENQPRPLKIISQHPEQHVSNCICDRHHPATHSSSVLNLNGISTGTPAGHDTAAAHGAWQRSSHNHGVPGAAVQQSHHQPPVLPQGLTAALMQRAIARGINAKQPPQAAGRACSDAVGTAGIEDRHGGLYNRSISDTTMHPSSDAGCRFNRSGLRHDNDCGGRDLPRIRLSAHRSKARHHFLRQHGTSLSGVTAGAAVTTAATKLPLIKHRDNAQCDVEKPKT